MPLKNAAHIETKNHLSLKSARSVSGNPIFCNSKIQLFGREQLLGAHAEFSSANPLPDGSLAHLNDGSEIWELVVELEDGTEIGEMVVEIEKERISAIHDLKISENKRHQGCGQYVAASIAASNTGSVRVICSPHNAKPFWASLGVESYNLYGNATLDWTTYEEARRERSTDQETIRQDSQNSESESISKDSSSNARNGQSTALTKAECEWLTLATKQGFQPAAPASTQAPSPATARYYQFGGSKARTANAIALKAAIQFDAEDRDPENIREKTGWFRGEDKKWRFEISDHEAKVVTQPFKQANNDNRHFRGKLKDILHHPKLYNAYPFIRFTTVDVNLAPGKQSGGTYLRPQLSNDGITNSKILIQARDETQLKELILKNVQYAIQDVEGFATAKNEEYLKGSYIKGLDRRHETLVFRRNELAKIEQRTPSQAREWASINNEITALSDAYRATHNGHKNGEISEVAKEFAGEREATLTRMDADLTEAERMMRLPFLPMKPGRQPIVTFNNTEISTLAAELDLTPRADIAFMPKETVIRLAKAADKSSFFHEAGHAFLLMEEQSARGKQPTEFQRRILDFLGAASMQYLTPEHHEKFATGFEQFMREGNAPQKGLSRVFELTKTWLSKIYQRTEDIGEPLHHEAKEIYKDLLSSHMPPSSDNVRQLTYHEDVIASQLVDSGIYQEDEARLSAKILGAYALAKVERDDNSPTIDKVFDRMNLRIESIELIDIPEQYTTFDFDTFHYQNLEIPVNDKIRPDASALNEIDVTSVVVETPQPQHSHSLHRR